MKTRLCSPGALWLLLSACSEDTERDAPPDWSEGYASNYVSPSDTGGDTADIDATRFGITGPDNLGYDQRVTNLTTGGDCLLDVADTTSGYQDLVCTIDLPELNLYGSGLTFDFSVPAGACDYVAYNFYMYEAWEVGVGPTEVSYTIGLDGNVYDEVNSVDKEPYCSYDYSYADSRDPNCCLGSYTLTVTVEQVDEKTKKTVNEVRVYPNRDWSGFIPDCYGGAAFTDPEATFNVQGWPTGKLVHLAEAAFTKRFSWEPPAAMFGTNVSLSNHYDTADHDGQAPAGLRGAWAQPDYVFQCYDNAEELLAQVRLVVREWNEEDQFIAEGDPETEGTEPVSGTPLNDRQDWADATPGANTFIQDRQ